MDNKSNLNLENLKIGIIGGTFDPIHMGHLFIAETALDQFKLDKVMFIPNGRTAHKTDELISNSIHRLAMLKLAIKSNPLFESSSIEIDREHISYSIDTIRELEKYYNNKAELHFIIGCDAFIEIETWKEYKSLLNITKFIVFIRDENNINILNEKIELFKKDYNAKIIKIQIPTLDISSTDIRNRIKRSNSIKYLLPEEVEKYIFKNKLYL